MPVFDLLETLRWTPGAGFLLLDRHLQRLCASAAFFGYPCDRDASAAKLAEAVDGHALPLRVRLLLSREGAVTIEQQPFERASGPVRLRLAAAAVDSNDVFLRHKTTARSVYDRARRPDCDDVVLWNERSELTETTIANLVFELDGGRMTPPVESGLLAGTYRAELLDRGELTERIVTLDDLPRVTRVWTINSVQEWRDARLER